MDESFVSPDGSSDPARSPELDGGPSGSPEPGSPEPGSLEPGSLEPGSPGPGSPDPGSPEPALPEPGSPEPALPDPGATGAAGLERSCGDLAVLEQRDLGWEELIEEARRLGPDPDLRSRSDEQLELEVQRLAAEVAVLTARWLEILCEFVVRGCWVVEGARTPAQWLSWKVGLAPGTAREHVRVALRLRELPQIRAAFAAGTLSYSKVRALTRIALPELEELLLEWAEVSTAAQLERIAADFRTTQRAVGTEGDGPRPDYAWRTRTHADGTMSVTLRGPVEECAELCALIERRVDAAARNRDEPTSDDDDPEVPATPPMNEGTVVQGSADGRSVWDERALRVAGAESDAAAKGGPSRAAAMVQELVDIVATAGAPVDTTGNDRHTLVLHAPLAELVEVTDTAPEEVATLRLLDVEPDPETRHDVVSEDVPVAELDGRAEEGVVAGVDGGAEQGAVAEVGGGDEEAAFVEESEVVEVASVESPVDAVTPDHEPPADRLRPVAVHDPLGRVRAVPRHVLRRLACEAGIVLAAVDGDGTPMDLGRRDRRLSVELRRAVHLRDRTCRFPGCDALRHLHVHHVEHWAEGGPTDLRNLVLVCSFHHRFVHAHGWDVEVSGDANHRFIDAEGRTLARHAPQPEPVVGQSNVQEDDVGRLQPAAYSPHMDRNTIIAVLQQEIAHRAPDLAA